MSELQSAAIFAADSIEGKHSCILLSCIYTNAGKHVNTNAANLCIPMQATLCKPLPANLSIPMQANLSIPLQANLSYLMSAAKLATAQRLIALAETKLKRNEEAEQTMITAMNVFKEAQLVKGLQAQYKEGDEDLDTGQLFHPERLNSRHELPSMQQASFATVDLCTVLQVCMQ